MKVARYRHATPSKPASPRGAIMPVPTLEELLARPRYEERSWGPYREIPIAAAHRAVRRAVREARAEVAPRDAAR